jgi:hypothetical protein
MKTQGRKPKDHNGKTREWTSQELHWLYMRGFKDGAGCTAMRPDHKDLDAYNDGYADGFAARSKAAKKHAKKVGYKPTILRAVKAE